MTAAFNIALKPSLAFRERLIPIFVSIVSALIVLFPSNPHNMTAPSRDSGVFLYVGWRFLKGDVPYRDVWDHKPPLIYFVDALGIALSPHSLWGVWLLQVIFVFFTLFFLYKLLDQEFGIYAALVGVVLLTSGLLSLFENGNVTEEYALVFQALCFWLFIKAWKEDFSVRMTFSIGVLGGLAFDFKQTTIGLWITYGLLLLIVRFVQRRFPIREFLSLLAGWLVPSLLLMIYLASQNTFKDYWEQVFLYNFAYIGKHGGTDRFISVFDKGMFSLQNGWVLPFSIFGWLMGLSYLWLRSKHLLKKVHPLILISVVNVPFETTLLTASGRALLHYYLTLLPVMAILAATSLFTASFLINQAPGIPVGSIGKLIPGVLLATALFGQISQVQHFPKYVYLLKENRYAPVVSYVIENTAPDDQVLLIGAESGVNFMAARKAPTRYVYQYPLGLLGRRAMLRSFSIKP